MLSQTLAPSAPSSAIPSTIPETTPIYLQDYSTQSRLWSALSTNDKSAYCLLADLSPHIALFKWKQICQSRRRALLKAMRAGFYLAEKFDGLPLAAASYPRTRCSHCGCETDRMQPGQGCHTCGRGAMVEVAPNCGQGQEYYSAGLQG